MAKSRLMPLVELTDGPIRGWIEDGVQQFVGIPYAAPPVGGLRWQPPRAPRRWQVPYDATEFRNVCAQNCDHARFGFDSESEDCLYLNVFAPEHVDPAKPCPVIVWIPGGGLIIGGSTGYDASKLVIEGEVIVVTFNYRVNIFGFFSHPALNTEGHARGNYGFMDQQFALQWVRDNIAKFGGDPDNVTIGGESAGGVSVWGHLASPKSAGLFHKAIVMSGLSVPLTHAPPIKALEDAACVLIENAGCSDQSADQLRLIPTAALLDANALPPGTFGMAQYPSELMIDGETFPDQFANLFAAGQFNRVPLILGTCRDEFAWFQGMMEIATGHIVSAEAYAPTLRHILAAMPPSFISRTIDDAAFAKILELYPPERYEAPSRASAAAIGDCAFICAGRRAIRALTPFIDIYAFEFDAPDSPSPWPAISFPYGSAHTLELQYIFPLFRGGSGVAHELNESQQQLATAMVDYITTFARHGAPGVSAGQEPDWTAYDGALDNYMSLRQPAPIMLHNFGERHKSPFWDSLPAA